MNEINSELLLCFFAIREREREREREKVKAYDIFFPLLLSFPPFSFLHTPC